MGVDTKAILRKGITIDELKKTLSLKYGEVEVQNPMPQFFYFYFSGRSMAVSYTNTCEKDNGISGIWCSLSHNEQAIEIMRYLCETFGGYLCENDCSEDFYPINFELYSKGTDLNNFEKFRLELLGLIGFENLNKSIEIINKYYTIK
jgi:hypothetical protein